MPKPREFCAIERDRLIDSLPPGHPAAEENSLTLFQQQALPTLLWFFDQDRSRATGRSHLMAYVLIELAMRGQRVRLEDLSVQAGERDLGQRWRRQFADMVLGIAHREFPHDIFHYNYSQNLLEYRGRKPYGQTNRNVR